MHEPLPASPISSWSDWPEDVVATLRAWNGERQGGSWHLRFEITATVGAAPPVFRCNGCNRDHFEPQFGVALLDGQPVCDGCLIVIARANSC